jgi:hypothetical protein
MGIIGGSMTPSPQFFQHRCNSAWLALATHESLLPPYLFDLSLEMAALIDETAPILVVQKSEQDEGILTPLLEQLSDAVGSGRIVRYSLDEVDLNEHQGGIGGLILQGGSPQDWVKAVPRLQWKEKESASPFIDLVLLTGAPCSAVGQWMLSDPTPDVVVPGLGWLPQGIVTPGLDHPADLGPVRGLLSDEPRSFAIGLPPGAILAIGRSGELEIWSDVKPGILLGKGWGQS